MRKHSIVAYGSSSIKIHYFDYLKRFINRMNEVYDFIEKNINFINFITICFAAITLVMVLAWFL